MITVVRVKPGKPAEIVEIENTLESLHKEVGGWFQIIYPFKDNVAVVCNDEGKLLRLEPNRILVDDYGRGYDVICGTFLVVGLSDEDIDSLTPVLAKKYAKLYGMVA